MTIALILLLQLYPTNSPIALGPSNYASLAQEICEPEAPSDNDIMVCAYHEFMLADKELNVAYQKAILATKGKSDPDASYDIKDVSKLVVTAQKAWLAMRDAHCSAIGVGWSGAHGRAASEFSCMTQLTKQRTEQLKELF